MRRAGTEEAYRLRMPEGRIAELDLFGTPKIDSEAYRKELARCTRLTERGRYIAYADALELAKRFQDGNPTNPRKDFLRELRIAVIDALDLPVDQADCVKAYSALDTPLDKLHGVDGFVTIETDGGNEITVTLDATLEPAKQTYGYKADVILGAVPDPGENEEAYLTAVEDYARQIVRQFQLKSEEGRRGAVHSALKRSDEGSARQQVT